MLVVHFSRCLNTFAFSANEPPRLQKLILLVVSISFHYISCIAARRPKQCKRAALCKTDFNRYLGNGRSNEKISKNEFRYREDFSHPVNWYPTKYISETVAQIKKIQKTKSTFCRIPLLRGPSPPSQLVPNPFNWSPNTVFN